MRNIIVAEHTFGTAIAPHTLDHRGVVQFVRINDQAWEQFWQGREGCIIGNIGRGEQQSRFLAVQIGQFGLKPFVIHGCA